MRRGIVLLFLIQFLAACASSGWPGQYGEDPTAYDFPVVEQRWAAASKSPLGSAQDTAEIKAAVDKVYRDVDVREIRWLSAAEVMVLAVRGGGLALGAEPFYGALKKDGDEWKLVAWYDGSAS